MIHMEAIWMTTKNNLRTLDALIKRMNKHHIECLEYEGIKLIKTKHYYLNDIKEEPIKPRELDPSDPEYEKTLFWSVEPTE
jgi:hypothetical protein